MVRIDPPFAPRDLKVTDYNTDYMTLTWTAPEHDGGSSILGYVVEKRDTFMNMWSPVGKVDTDTLGIRVTGLFEGQSYLFRVAAENQCGRSDYVETVKSVTAKLPFGETLNGFWCGLPFVMVQCLLCGICLVEYTITGNLRIFKGTALILFVTYSL